jgi:phosphoribosylformylglycinamidine synthase
VVRGYPVKYYLKIEVRLKPAHIDPEGETTRLLLKELGYDVETVNVSRVYRILLDAQSQNDAVRKGEEMCRRLLANPTKDNYSVSVEENT